MAKAVGVTGKARARDETGERRNEKRFESVRVFSKTGAIFLLMLILVARPVEDEDRDSFISETWDYTEAMRKIVDRSKTREGVVLHIGDSMTLAPEYGAWALRGSGKTAEDRAVLDWMHAGAGDESDGWFLAAGERSLRRPSRTACGGIRTDEILRGGKLKLPSLAEMLDRYRPQIVVLMLGTNDIWASRRLKDTVHDISKCVDLILESGAVCILSTIPPYPGRVKESTDLNQALRTIAERRRIPLIDFEREILSRRPTDWNGTLLATDDVHPTASRAGVSPESEPSRRNLRESGYLLRGRLSVWKIAEVKRKVFDPRSAVDRFRTDERPATMQATKRRNGRSVENFKPTTKRPDPRITHGRDPHTRAGKVERSAE